MEEVEGSFLEKGRDSMADLYDRYRQGAYQEVYDELLAMQEHIYEPPIYEEALLVMRELMRRVRMNIESLIARLHSIGYHFGKGGFWQEFAPEQQSAFSPVFQSPPSGTSAHLARLEQLAGPLPLALKCWYEEVGRVNLIGLFAANKRGDGSIFDPLYIESLEQVLKEAQVFLEIDGWPDRVVILAPDQYHKYGFSGAGAYTMALPCKALDAPFVNEPHHTTFVNYLRVSLRWGGFPGLATEPRLVPEEMDMLTKDLVLF